MSKVIHSFLVLIMLITSSTLNIANSKEASFCKLWIQASLKGQKIEEMDGYELYTYLKNLGVAVQHLNLMLGAVIDPDQLTKTVDTPSSRASLLALAREIEKSKDLTTYISQLNRIEMAVREQHNWTGPMSELASREWKRLEDEGIKTNSRFDLFKEVFEYYPLPELAEAFQTVGTNLQIRYSKGNETSDIPDNMIPALVDLAIKKKERYPNKSERT